MNKKSILFLIITAVLASCTQPENNNTTVQTNSINFRNQTLSLAVGDSVTPEVTILPKPVSYTLTSSNSSIVSVNGSGITGVAEGEAVITAKINGTELNDSMTVTVTQGKIAVTGLSLKNNSLILEANGTAIITPVISPENATDKTFTAVSSTPSVATVTNTGEITLLSPGTTVITFTSTEGSFSDVLNLEVTPVAVTGIYIPSNTESVPVGKDILLNVSVLPAAASNQLIHYTSSDESIVTVSPDGILTGKSVGTTSVTAVTDDGSFSDSISVTVTEYIPVESIAFSDGLTTWAGDTGSVINKEIIITPSNASIKDFDIVSSSENFFTYTTSHNLIDFTTVINGSYTIDVISRDNPALKLTLDIQAQLSGNQPQIMDIFFTDNSTILVHFDKQIDQEILLNPQSYSVVNSESSLELSIKNTAQLNVSNYESSVLITLDRPLENFNRVTLSLRGILSVAGYHLQSNTPEGDYLHPLMVLPYLEGIDFTKVTITEDKIISFPLDAVLYNPAPLPQGVELPAVEFTIFTANTETTFENYHGKIQMIQMEGPFQSDSPLTAGNYDLYPTLYYIVDGEYAFIHELDTPFTITIP